MAVAGRWNLQGRIVKEVKITPADSGLLQYDALHIFGGGNIKYWPKDNAAVNADALAVTDNTILPIAVRGVYSTGTTATNIYGCIVEPY